MPRPGRITQPGVAKSAPALDEAISELAGRQHAVAALWQLVELGLSSAAVRRRAKVARLHRIHTGVYSLVPRRLLTREGYWMAAVLACGSRAALSHRDAAALHGLRPTARTKIDVTVPGRSCREHQGLDVHRSTTLTRADVTIEKHVPCTTIARTILDLAAVLPRRPIERALDQAEAMGVFDLLALNDQLDRNPNHPGATLLRSVLGEHYVGSTLTASELEEAFLALCRRLQLPQPKLNRWIDLGKGEWIRGDFVWYEQRVIVETDGQRYHGTHQAQERDPRRDQRATVAGWRPVRTTRRQVMQRPRELEATLLALLRAPLPAGSG